MDKVWVVTKSGKRLLRAVYERYGVWCVTRAVNIEGWAVTHAPSGRTAYPYELSRAEASHLCKGLGYTFPKWLRGAKFGTTGERSKYFVDVRDLFRNLLRELDLE